MDSFWMTISGIVVGFIFISYVLYIITDLKKNKKPNNKKQDE